MAACCHGLQLGASFKSRSKLFRSRPMKTCDISSSTQLRAGARTPTSAGSSRAVGWSPASG
jgi:hypothetical protein